MIFFRRWTSGRGMSCYFLHLHLRNKTILNRYMQFSCYSMCFGCFLTTTSTISQIFFCLQKKQKITKATISTCVLSVWGQCVQHLHIDEPRWLWKTQDQGVLLVEVRSVGDSLWPVWLKFVPRSFQFFRGKHPKPIPSMYGIFTVYLPTFGCF